MNKSGLRELYLWCEEATNVWCVRSHQFASFCKYWWNLQWEKNHWRATWGYNTGCNTCICTHSRLYPPFCIRKDWIGQLGIQLNLDLALLRHRFRCKCDGIKLLTQSSEEILHLKVCKLLSWTDSRAMVKRNVLPLATGLPWLYSKLAKEVSSFCRIKRKDQHTPSFRYP